MTLYGEEESRVRRLLSWPGRVVAWLGAVGWAIVWPFEWLLALAGRKLVAASDGLEGAESLVVRIGWALLAPVRLAARLVRAAVVAVLPERLRHALGLPLWAVGLFGYLAGQALVRVGEALYLDGILLGIVRWTRPLWYPFAALVGFFQAWLATRQYRELVWGLPVVLVLVPLAGVAAWTMLWGRGSIAAQYRVAAKEAREAKDFQRVRLYERKLAQLGVSTELTRFRTAVALAEDGKVDEAYAAMQELATAEQSGYPQAHWWIVQQIMKGALPLSAEEGHRLIKIHLDHLQSLGVQSLDLDMVRAVWLTQDGRPEEAAELLQPLARDFAPAALMRLELNLRLKNIEAARGDALHVRTHMENQTRRGSALSGEEYQFWSIAEELLGERSKAQELAKKRVEIEPENAQARAVLAQHAWRMYERVIAEPGPDADYVAELFVEAAEVTADALELQQQADALFRLRGEIDFADEVIRAIGESPRASARTLEAIGTMAAQHGLLGEGHEYLRRATARDPQNAVAWNNFAWITIQLPDGDAREALAAVNQALALVPDEYRFRETRGQIQLRLGRWREAVADLEYAANGMPDSHEIHRSLARAYDALGEEQLAQVHRERGQ